MERIYLNNTYGHGLFIESSRMNHSCLPCVEMSMDEGKETEVRSVREIDEGEEITVSYLKTSLLLPRKRGVRDSTTGDSSARASFVFSVRRRVEKMTPNEKEFAKLCPSSNTSSSVSPRILLGIRPVCKWC